MTIERREVLGAALAGGVGSAVSALPAPAIAQGMPTVRWRCASSYPKSLDTIYGGGEEIARRVAEATDGNFQIRVYAGGELVPGLQVLDAVRDHTVECGHTTSFYYVGKDPTFAFDTAVPFGFNARQQNAWMTHGGGLELMRAFFKTYNIIQFPAGNTGTQMGGWFRRAIDGPEDLRGLKMRIGGLGGRVMARLGVVPQQIAGSDVYEALERGSIDAVEWSGPYDDEKLGFHRVAEFYYAPGWWEGGAQITMMANIDAFEALPPNYKRIFENACAAANTSMLGRYDVGNAVALRQLVAEGAKLRVFPRAVMLAAREASDEVLAEEAAKNPTFASIYQSWGHFRDDIRLWFRVAEFAYDSYVFNAPPPG